MPTASSVAAELRKLADSLDQHPDAVVVAPYVSLWAEEKEPFLAVAACLPRPLKKTVSTGSYPRVELKYDSPALRIACSVPQDKTCILVKPAQPAVFECDPILSQIEEAALATL